MTRASMILLWFVLASLSADAANVRWPSWLERAPLNTDINFVDPSLPFWGFTRALRYLSVLLNLPVLAGLIYAFEKERADFSYFFYVFIGILLGSFLLSLALNPLIGVFSMIPIIALESFLLLRFCVNSLKSAIWVALLFHVFQVGCVLVYRTIAVYYA